MLPGSGVKPLLPVSHRHVQKRSRRKGSCMRLVIMTAILFCVGYAVFATRYIGGSKNRKEVQDSLVKAKLERKLTVPVSANGAQHDGRTLKADAHASRVPARDHSSLHRIKTAGGTHKELDQDVFAGGGSYDDVVARDRARQDQVQAQAGIRSPGSGSGSQQAHQQHHGAIESGREDLQARAPLVAPVDHHIGQQNPHRQQQQQQPQQHHEQQQQSQFQQPQPHANPKKHHFPQQQQQDPYHQQQQQQQHVSSPLVAGPVEADRDAELRRQAAVVSPSLAVGSRIEADSHTAAGAGRSVSEPGALHVGSGEPTNERAPVHVAAPNIIPVTHLEPDSHQAQQQLPAVHQPLITPVPHETDSATHTVQHHAPEDTPRSPGGTGTTTTAPVTVAAPVVTAPVHVPSPVVAEPVRSPHADTAPQRNPLAKGLYALEAVDIDGKVRSLSEFAGKVTIVVNVASACGYTDENYKGLMKVYDKYRAHGLEILGFPCNQFGSQESGTEADIKNFCSGHYHVTFPMFSKVDVNGPHTHPVYQFLKRELSEYEGGGAGKGPGQDLVWNFQKIFVDHQGRPVKRLYQAWDQNAVESEVYRLLREARQAGS
ncbi:hypothetical protein PLESTB_001255800 [Pleodorina starrii]|uniref:Glutathione peroxidase n=1 Tax=Pleodorina starrii TaxID=330485 RepID=A0A9W6F6K8_9CHLO|nr:hypothetical protein PLESTM_000204200 [Pleodorina starrii]GLC57705.1 hypothetical protein PLESTB_001255800 [Pleodorina starrii]GLC63375.1 hypothetical protein PLESTF_000029600 [Pleodorina starrii]